MYPYHMIKEVYSHLQDEPSRFIFMKRLEYSLNGNQSAIAEIVDEEIKRYQSKDVMHRLFSWLGEQKREKITVFGAGFAGTSICAVLQRRGIRIDYIADNNKRLWDSKWNSIKIISPEMIGKDSLVIIGVNSCVSEILQQVLSLGVEKKQVFIPDKAWWIGDSPQYFEQQIMCVGKDEVFIDGGSLDGSDSLNFIKWCNGNYQGIYAFEPDTYNYKHLYNLSLQKQNMKVFEEGLWSEEKMLYFASGRAENSTISDMGDTMVKVTSIDRKLKGEKATFIKMDIEGSEMEALIGAESTIRKYKPKLAICVYHRPEDILDIPQKILGLNPEYKLYLRHYSYVNTETVLYAI